MRFSLRILELFLFHVKTVQHLQNTIMVCPEQPKMFVRNRSRRDDTYQNCLERLVSVISDRRIMLTQPIVDAWMVAAHAGESATRAGCNVFKIIQSRVQAGTMSFGVTPVRQKLLRSVMEQLATIRDDTDFSMDNDVRLGLGRKRSNAEDDMEEDDPKRARAEKNGENRMLHVLLHQSAVHFCVINVDGTKPGRVLTARALAETEPNAKRLIERFLYLGRCVP